MTRQIFLWDEGNFSAQKKNSYKISNKLFLFNKALIITLNFSFCICPFKIRTNTLCIHFIINFHIYINIYHSPPHPHTSTTRPRYLSDNISTKTVWHIKYITTCITNKWIHDVQGYNLLNILRTTSNKGQSMHTKQTQASTTYILFSITQCY